MSNTKGYIHSIETFGSVDGPGVRFVIFMQGCRFRCAFCHNPDTWRLPRKMVNSDNSESEERDKENASTNQVVENSNLGGLKVLTPEDLLEKALRYRTYWGDEGGITVSGGEPLLQIDFLIEFFELCRKNNVNTCLDTAAGPYVTKELIERCIDENRLRTYAMNLGLADCLDKEKIAASADLWHEKFLRLMKMTDTVLLDIKEINDEKHKSLVGFSNENVLACAKELSDLNIPVYIRHVLLPEFSGEDKDRASGKRAGSDDEKVPEKISSNEKSKILEKISDTEKDLIALRKFIDTLRNVKKVEVLPYHTMGVYKYESLGIDYRLKDIDPPADERVKAAKRILCE